QYISYSLMDMPHGGACTLESRHLSPLAKACSSLLKLVPLFCPQFIPGVSYHIMNDMP
uniref:Uncharacterized protein n=1 Tax=Aegilops tauschii subsp. strangulata TaxID=200361 RepID=A0A453LSN8_AEGTS